MWYVYSGYVSSDNYDSSETPCYNISEFNSEDEVLEFKAEFEEGLCDECSNPIFRVFKGEEKKIGPVEVVAISYKIV